MLFANMCGGNVCNVALCIQYPIQIDTNILHTGGWRVYIQMDDGRIYPLLFQYRERDYAIQHTVVVVVAAATSFIHLYVNASQPYACNNKKKKK